MTAADTIDESSSPPKRGRKLLLFSILFALFASGLGYFAAYTGMILSSSNVGHETDSEPAHDALEPVARSTFLPLDPLIVTIRSSSKYRLLRFTAQLEVWPDHLEEVVQLQPRIVDVMNTYLNAIEARDFEDPIAMIKLRAQLLRRIQVVTEKGRVKDLLIMEFVLQ